MAEAELAGCRILVAEDEYVLAADSVRLLKGAGATIIGPVGTLEQARELAAQDGFDAAILDIRLDEELVYPVAELLQDAGIPMAFLTGYDQASVPARFSEVPLCQKPCSDEVLIRFAKTICSR